MYQCASPTDLFDVTVWREVQGVLAHPERVAEEYQRRLQTTTAGTHQVQATLEAQLGKVRQGLARLIDSYAEGLLEKHEFEPRITRLRQRLTQLEEQRQQLIDVTALQTEIRLIVGRLEDFAAKIDAGLEDSDWLSKREMIRALVKRVEVTPERVNVVFRVDSYPGEASPEKKSLLPPVQHAPYRETCTRQPALVRHSEARVDPQPEHHGGGEVPDLRSRARPPRGMGPAAVPPLPPRPRRPPRGESAVPPRTAPAPPRAERTRSHGPAGGAPPCRGQILVHQAASRGQEVRETPGDQSAGQAQDGGTLRHRERLRHLDADAHREDGALVRRQGRMRPHDAAPGHLLRNGRPRRTGARACAHQIGTGWPRCPGRSQYLRPDTRRPGTPPGTGNTGRCRPGSR